MLSLITKGGVCSTTCSPGSICCSNILLRDHFDKAVTEQWGFEWFLSLKESHWNGSSSYKKKLWQTLFCLNRQWLKSEGNPCKKRLLNATLAFSCTSRNNGILAGLYWQQVFSGRSLYRKFYFETVLNNCLMFLSLWKWQIHKSPGW